MKSREFRLYSTWRVRGSIDDVYAVLTEPIEFVRWWPSVYLDVEELAPGRNGGVGRVLRLQTKGKLPYTLEWRATVTAVDKPNRIAIRAQGDMTGSGEWRLAQSGGDVEIHYTWVVEATKPWMNVLAPVLRPVFAANHRWAMREGEQGLRRELARRAQAR